MELDALIDAALAAVDEVLRDSGRMRLRVKVMDLLDNPTQCSTPWETLAWNVRNMASTFGKLGVDTEAALRLPIGRLVETLEQLDTEAAMALLQSAESGHLAVLIEDVPG